ncbi:MAG: ABC transporter ATP-binding protein [Bacteroidetes bacterium]|nr:MAG: ABC transporter ATP-binding protein [Bacteroidota bacterium]
MKKFTKVLKYIVPYWRKAVLNVSFNLLSIIFSLFSVTMAIPFLGILFKNESLVTSIHPFTFSAASIKEYFYYYLSQMILDKGPAATLFFVSILIVLMTFFKTFFKYMAMYFLSPIRNGVVRDIRNSIYTKTLNLPLSYFSDERKGDIISRMTSDVQEIEWSIMSSLEMIFRDPISIIVYLGALFFMSTKLTLFVLVLLPLSGLIIGQLGKKLRKKSFLAQTKMGYLLSIIEETLGGLRIIKAFNAETKIADKFYKENNSYTRVMTSMLRRRDLASPLSEFLGTAVMVVIMWYGSSLVLADKSALTSQEFIGYLMLFYLLIAPVKSFSSAFYNIQKGMASADRIDGILLSKQEIKEKKNAKSIEDFSSSIEYKNVTFSYIKDTVLKDINIKIEKGKKIALVGQSGSGKSTLVDLLPRFYDISKGDILIDGISVKDYKILDLRNLMGNVNQESILFNDTVFNNIAFGVENATQEQVVEAAKVANAHEFIAKMPEAYQTNIGDRGSKLSGGQRQRISIARAVLKNPPIMILDEATSALDTESERLVQDALENLMRNRTSIVIAHRLSTVVNVDEIYVLQDGVIIEKGKHKDLIKIDGAYKRLYELQSFS